MPDDFIDELIDVYRKEYIRSPRTFGELLEVFS